MQVREDKFTQNFDTSRPFVLAIIWYIYFVNDTTYIGNKY